MANVKVTLKDGSVKEVAAGTTLLEVAKGLSQKLGKQALLAVVDGVNKDLTDKLEHDSSVEFVVPESSEGLHAIRHTAAHIMAQAIQHLFPDTKFAIGPAIANGFYYDLDSEHVFVPEDLIAIEKEMAKIVKANLPLVRSELPRSEALKMFADKDEKYKVELINDLPEDAVISTYTQGDFTDLCAGPHCPSTGRVKAFKLQSIAGAYWRGDEKIKCCSVSTAPLFLVRKNWTLICICLKKLPDVIIENLAKSWICSVSWKKVLDSRFPSQWHGNPQRADQLLA